MASHRVINIIKKQVTKSPYCSTMKKYDICCPPLHHPQAEELGAAGRDYFVDTNTH
jgi:hypothetical protein